ncbi:MAG: NTP transferase domain-containing protein [Alphaproteobacteria bacterium]|nr:NTP transferase domain-containing protein [Alphaproteobacteria bacterium]
MKITTAMLLSAGLGTRMRPLTDTMPKPLVTVAGRTLLDRVLDKLVAQGVTRAVVNVHHFADQVEAHLRPRTDIEIVISDERAQLMETGGGVLQALPLLGTAPFFVVNTDVTWATRGDKTFAHMADAYDPERMDALLLLADIDQTLGFRGPGDFFLGPDGQLERRGAATRAPYVFAGTHITSADRLRGFKPEPMSANVYWNAFAAAGRLYGAVMEPFWMHVGDPAGRDEAEARLLAMGTGN